MTLKHKHKTFAAEFKAVEDGEAGEIEGYGSVFGNVDSYGDIIAKGAFAADIKEGKMPVMLWQHDSRQPIGIYTEISEDKKGLKLKGQINLETQQGREAYALLKQGALKGMSIGFNTRKSSFDEVEKTRTLTDLELWEVSIVTFPANDRANVEGVKGQEDLPQTIREFEGLLRDAGLPNSWARTTASAAWPVLQKEQRDAADADKQAAEEKEATDALSTLLATLKK